MRSSDLFRDTRGVERSFRCCVCILSTRPGPDGWRSSSWLCRRVGGHASQVDGDEEAPQRSVYGATTIRRHWRELRNHLGRQQYYLFVWSNGSNKSVTYSWRQNLSLYILFNGWKVGTAKRFAGIVRVQTIYR